MSEDRKPYKPLVKVGALWKRESRNAGYVYLSGEITLNGEKYHIKVFPVREEWKKANGPDFEIKTELDVASADVPQPTPYAHTQTEQSHDPF